MIGCGGRPDGAALVEERGAVDLQLRNEQDIGCPLGHPRMVSLGDHANGTSAPTRLEVHPDPGEQELHG